MYFQSKVVERHFNDLLQRYGECVAVDLTDKVSFSLSVLPSITGDPTTWYTLFILLLIAFCGRFSRYGWKNLGPGFLMSSFNQF